MTTPMLSWSIPVALIVTLVSGCKGREREGGERRGKRDHQTPTVTAVAPGAPVGKGPSRTDGKTRPNVLFVLADDQRADTLTCMPKLKRLLGARGTTFRNNFASTPLCCPGRSTVLTGKYAHNHGVLANGDIEDEDGDKSPGAIDFQKGGNEEKVFAGWLQKRGYRTGYFGKYLNAYDKLLESDPTHVPSHWDEWRAFSHAEYFDFDMVERGLGESKVTRRCYLTGTAADEKKGKKRVRTCKGKADEIVRDGAENYSTDVLRDQVIRFVRAAETEGKPWFVHLAPKAPHGPFFSPARYQPDPDEPTFTKEAMDRLASCPLMDWKDRPASYLEADMSDKPQWIQESKSKRTAEARLDKVRRMQLASVLATEDAIEEIMKVLAELGVADDTVIVYSADNGFAWGEHWHTHKNCAYEECIRVPLLVLDPRVAGGPRTIDAFTMNVDLAPTFAAWAGATPVGKMDGFSFAPLVDGGGVAAWPRKRVLSECWGPGTQGRPDTHASVRTSKWKYVEHYTDPKRTTVRTHKNGHLELELYDLERDPHELDNLLRLSPEALAKTRHTRAEIDATTVELRRSLAELKVE